LKESCTEAPQILLAASQNIKLNLKTAAKEHKKTSSTNKADLSCFLCLFVARAIVGFMQGWSETFQLADGGMVELRPISDSDDQFLLGVYASTREDELAQAEWAEGQKEMFVRWQFDLQRREYDARFPDAAYNVILVDQQRAGRIWVGSDDEQIRLLDIALLPEFQNRGVGTALLRRLMNQAANRGKVLRHMVFVLNNNAERFYERLGFNRIEDLGAYKHMEWRP
jgi:ribosomal protein S18 acetylase RimI-like enzyme